MFNLLSFAGINLAVTLFCFALCYQVGISDLLDEGYH